MIPASRESVLDMSGSCQHITERQVHHEKESKSYLKMPHNRNGDDEWYICQCKLPMARVAAYAIDSAYKRISHTEARDIRWPSSILCSLSSPVPSSPVLPSSPSPVFCSKDQCEVIVRRWLDSPIAALFQRDNGVKVTLAVILQLS